MALPISLQNRNRLEIPGGKPRFELYTYSISGHVLDWSNRGITGVQIKFIDRQSNVEISHAWTDASGMFQAVVRMNADGYRVTPYKIDWGFTPAFFDVADKTEGIWFHGKYFGKGDSKEDSGSK